MKKELKKVLYQLFDLREKERAQEMERIQERLARLHKEMEERKKHKDQIVENRLNELTGKGYLYEW